MRIRTPEILERNWGREVVAIRTVTHAGKVLERTKGTVGGFQMHVKEESHYLVQGRIKLRYYESGQMKEQYVGAGQSWTVEPLTLHQEEALEDCIVFEVSDPTSEDRYGIVPDPGALPSMSDQDAVDKLITLADCLRQRADECAALAQCVHRSGLARVAESQTT